MGNLREPVSGLSHLAGALLSVAGLAVLLQGAITRGTPWHVVAFAVFGASLILLYTASAAYHLIPATDRRLLTLRRLDHMMIFVLIAGSYTPFCLLPLRGAWGWSLFAAIWTLALVGVLMKVFWLHAPRWLYTAFYLGMGWLVVVAAVPLVRVMPAGGLAWLAAGGAFYSVGAVVYATRWPNLVPRIFGFHELWHLFVLAGSFSHFWAVWRYLMPAA